MGKKKNPEVVQSFPEFSLSFPEFSPKKMDLRISLVLIGVLAFVHSGEAIKCHQCTSYTEAGCGDPFDGDFSKDCPADTAEKIHFCRKIFQNGKKIGYKRKELMFYPLDSPNTKKTKTKMLGFYKQQSYFSQNVSKNSQNNNKFFYDKFQK